MKRIRKDDELRPEYDFSKLTPAPKNRRPRLSPLVMVCLEFKPDAAHINALPDPLGRFIHHIETNADPAGIIRENILVRDENKMLRALVEKQQRKIKRLERKKTR